MQSFTYDAHDKLTSGTAGNESDTYDLNGSETRISLGGYVYGFTYDDEDRLVQANYPGGVVDTFVYNGLGLRVAKTDSTGSYSYLCDGASAASPVLWDGHAVYTPGLSENRGGSSSYYENDRLGNLWTLDYGSGKGYSAGYNFSGFGSWVYAEGSTGNPFKFGGGNGCQTGADIGLVLMGHRYYDTRIGRFISQDPAGDGDNWYAYADNDPIDEVDPDGLFSQGMPSTDQTMSHDLMIGFMGGFEFGESGFGGAGSVTVTKYTHTWFDVHPNGPGWVHEPGSDTYSQEDITFNMGGMGGAMFAAAPKLSGSEAGPDGTRYRMDFKEKPVPDMHIVHSGGETNITHKGGYRQGIHRGQRLVPLPKKLRPSYRPIIKAFMKRAAQIINDFGEEFGRSQLNGGAAADTALEEAAGE